MSDGRKAWDPDNHGYGKHDYQHIDPDTINAADFAKSLRGEEQHFGDVRQYNSGYNEKSPENRLDLDWLSRVGTIFTTQAPGFEGLWYVTNMPVVRSPNTFIRAVKVETKDSEPEGGEVELSCVAMGVVVNEKNLYEQVAGEIVAKGGARRSS